MVMALYNEPTARIAINGTLSEAFTLEQGTRQVCPLSPALFLLALLLQDIKLHPSIKGFSFQDLQVKLAAYADDILIVTEDPHTSIIALMQVIETTREII